jgi:uridylate kinase
MVKISGEVLAGSTGFGVDRGVTDGLVGVLSRIAESGTGVAVVLGGGNFFRGRQRGETVDRLRADFMGMLGTVINGLALEGAMERAGKSCLLTSAIPVPGAVREWDVREADAALTEGSVVLCAGGTGNPYLTTDTASALRAVQLGCDLLLKGTKVDGVYSGDPHSDPHAERYDRISYNEFLQMNLGVMDAAAVAICRDESLPVVVFDIVSDLETIARAVTEPEATGTLIVGGD